MARRKARIPQGKKIQPAVKTMAFNMSANQVATIDLSQCASLLNRRFYRQGLNWAVSGFTFFTTGTGQIGISKIPDTWVASNSWEKGFHVWQRMNNEALEEADSVKPKFLDFKVFMDDIHHTNGVAANLLPVDNLGNIATPGEWEYSQYIIPVGTASPGATADRDIIWTGSNFPGFGASGRDAVSLIEGYAASRGLPDILDPNTPDDAASADGFNPENWMSAVFNEGTDQTEDVLENMIDENNIAPYPFENDGTHIDTMYPGGANQLPGLEIHDSLLVTGTTIGGKTTSHGGNFQGGLIRLQTVLDSGTCSVLVHLVPGHHRGYLAEPMQDV